MVVITFGVIVISVIEDLGHMNGIVTFESFATLLLWR